MHAVGSGAAIVSAGRFGAITLWPEAELRSIAEAAGFVLPTRAPPGVESSGAVTRQATISQVTARLLKMSFRLLRVRVVFAVLMDRIVCMSLKIWLSKAKTW